jgi:hypothetical protein
MTKLAQGKKSTALFAIRRSGSRPQEMPSSKVSTEGGAAILKMKSWNIQAVRPSHQQSIADEQAPPPND